MKSIPVLLYCMFCFTELHAQNRPAFNEVLKTFFSRYYFESPEVYIKFQKKKAGWYIVEDSYENPGHYGNEKLFWSTSSGSYLPLDYSAVINDNNTVDSLSSAYLNSIGGDFETYYYTRNLYYGYPGWDWDVIQELGPKKEMTDTLYESLGRAYTNYASGFLYDQYGDLFENNDRDRVKLNDTDTISNSRILKFVSYEKKAIDAYKVLMDKNPGYQTRVGNIKLKWANEYLYAYSTMMMAGDSVNAHQMLKDVDYSDSLLIASKGYLGGMPLNSILITGGDNDTYPLWYLQEVKNFRKDVIVINTSLLGLRRYVKMLDQKYNGSLFSTPDSVYYKNNFDYAFYDEVDKSPEPMSVKAFIDSMNNYHARRPAITTQQNGNLEMKTEPVYKGEILKQYKTNLLFFTENLVPKNSASNVSINKSIKLNRYIMMNQFMMLDIINQNLSTRGVYFTYQESFFKNILRPDEMRFKIDPSYQD